MRVVFGSTAVLALMMLTSNAFSQPQCLRPEWTECIRFPNGGRHTGVDPQNTQVQAEVPAGAEICVSLHWEIMAEEYAEFTRDGMPWPKPDWDVKVETFCFYRN
jgi:hypothetical protein